MIANGAGSETGSGTGTAADGRSRTIARVCVYGMLAQAIVILLILTGRPQVLLPVTATVGGKTVDLTDVDLALAVLTLLMLAVVSLAPVLGRIRGFDGFARGTESVIVMPVVVFLVACLNGVTEVAALVPIYALASGAACLVALEPVDQQRSRRRLSLAAAIGIVPWGVVAFTQIGSLIVGGSLSTLVQVITLVMLAMAVLRFVLEWRMRRGGTIAAAPSVITAAVTYSLLAWLVVVGVISVG